VTRIYDSSQTCLPCFWQDCNKAAQMQFRAVVRQADHDVWFAFCSERHKMYWVNGHRAFGTLPAGAKSLLT